MLIGVVGAMFDEFDVYAEMTKSALMVGILVDSVPRTFIINTDSTIGAASVLACGRVRRMYADAVCSIEVAPDCLLRWAAYLYIKPTKKRINPVYSALSTLIPCENAMCRLFTDNEL